MLVLISTYPTGKWPETWTVDRYKKLIYRNFRVAQIRYPREYIDCNSRFVIVLNEDTDYPI